MSQEKKVDRRFEIDFDTQVEDSVQYDFVEDIDARKAMPVDIFLPGTDVQGYGDRSRSPSVHFNRNVWPVDRCGFGVWSP